MTGTKGPEAGVRVIAETTDSTGGDRTPRLMDGGRGSSPRAVHIQICPIHRHTECQHRIDAWPPPTMAEASALQA